MHFYNSNLQLGCAPQRFDSDNVFQLETVFMKMRVMGTLAQLPHCRFLF